MFGGYADGKIQFVEVDVVDGKQQQPFGVAVDTNCQISSLAAEQQSGVMQL